jgi:hypothetical protein
MHLATRRIGDQAARRRPVDRYRQGDPGQRNCQRGAGQRGDVTAPLARRRGRQHAAELLARRFSHPGSGRWD